jgi:GMP synthase (glutamine-hydrolysing)
MINKTDIRNNLRKILVLQHVPFEILGTLNPLLKKKGFRVRYINFGRYPDAQPTLEGYHGLIVLGGPMGVNEQDAYGHLKTEITLIQAAVQKNIPILGICLGAQLIAAALGAEITRNPEKEIGWYAVTPTKVGELDPLFKHFQGTETIFQWHGDSFALPKDSVLLASSQTCRNQAFRYNHNIYGFQFHLEVDEPLINRWLTIPMHAAELAALPQTSAEHIRAQTQQYIENTSMLSENVFLSFLRLFGETGETGETGDSGESARLRSR